MANSSLKTIILRFRDLPVTETIKRHQELEKKYGYVWWGWWSKPQEKVPREEFSDLVEMSHRKDGLEIMLFDSGKKCLHTATCIDIEYCRSDETIPCPEKEKAPGYYSDSSYLAWFKLKNISDPIKKGEALSFIRRYTYLKVDSFFRSGKSPFIPFYGKALYSFDELVEQSRTIWFVRDKKKGDRNHEIHSYSDSLSIDKNVDRSFRLLRSEDMLWLSDLHFSEKHHAFKPEQGSDNRLQIRLGSELSNIDKTISHIIISGDFTFSAAEEEYADALEFIKYMNSVLDLRGTNYSIAPGNHDLKFSEKEYKEDDKVSVAFESSKENYVKFYHQVYGNEPTETLYSIRRLLTPELIPIEIISVNSCVLQQDKDHFRGMGFVGQDQMREIENELAMTKEKNVFRILSMHHHLMPVMFSEEPKVEHMYSLTLDSESIAQFILRNNIKMVLHGHTHKDFYSEVTRFKGDQKTKQKYYVIGIGSAGATQTALSDGTNNMFGILSFKDNSVQVSIYSLYANGQTSVKIRTYEIPYNESI